MFRRSMVYSALAALVFVLAPLRAHAVDLGIQPVAQQTPQWCFAAAAEMIFRHYGFPNINPAGNYQCGIVGAQGGVCAMNCGACLGAGGTTMNVAQIMTSYANYASVTTGFVNPTFHLHLAGILSPSQIVQSIDTGAPIMAGISPHGMAYPPGWGASEHAVVIVGYEGSTWALNLLINDPLPQNVALYSAIGASSPQPGQYLVPYNAFIASFHYGNSILFGW